MANNQHTSLLSDTLEQIFGLDNDTSERVLRTIKSSHNSIDVRTYNVRRRIGTRGMKHLHNSIDIATDRGKEKKVSKKTTTESITFTEFLLTEVSIDLDLDDAQGSMIALRKAQQQNKMSPDRVNKDNMAKAKREQRNAQQSGDDPTSNIRANIARKKLELGRLNKSLNSMTKRTNQRGNGGQR